MDAAIADSTVIDSYKGKPNADSARLIKLQSPGQVSAQIIRFWMSMRGRDRLKE
jgi:hypothetical protein